MLFWIKLIILLCIHRDVKRNSCEQGLITKKCIAKHTNYFLRVIHLFNNSRKLFIITVKPKARVLLMKCIFNQSLATVSMARSTLGLGKGWVRQKFYIENNI